MIDTHSHLADDAFTNDLEEVLLRARRAQVTRILVMGEDEEDNAKVLKICQDHPDDLIPCFGLFPDRVSPERMDRVEARIRAHAANLGAIGEVGLDFRLATCASEKARQEEGLHRFVRLSLETGLPLSLHSRAAGKRAIQLLLEAGAEKVILHAFDGKAGHALPGAEGGFYFSIPPSLVRSRQKERLVKLLPLERLLLESDAPVLGPIPDKRNEPSFISITLERISELKEADPLEVAAVLAENCRALFGDRLGGQ